MRLVVLHIIEIWRLRRLIKENGCPIGNGDLYGFHVADGNRLGGAFDIRQRPVIAVVGDAEVNFFRRNFCQRIFDDLADFVDWRDRHCRAVGISPLVGHQQYIVGRFSQQAIIFSLIEKPGLRVGSFGRKRDGDRKAQCIYGGAHFTYKIGKSKFVFGEDIFKVNVYARKAAFLDLGAEIFNQLLLCRFIVYHPGD